MTDAPKIAVIGSVNLDIVAKVPRLPCAGETVTGATLAYYPGGKGANQALAAARLGAGVSMFACVGDDDGADQALSLLHASGMDLSGLTVLPGQVTGVGLIAVSDDGENQIIVAPGANDQMKSDYLAIWRTTKFHATICELEIPNLCIEAIAATVEGFFAINLAPARDLPDSVLARADLIIVNEIEAAFYGDKLHTLSGLVVVTLGAAGATMYQGSDGARIFARPPKVVPVDTTGAGDTFVGALVVALLEGQSRQDALTFACAAGAATTLKAGAQPSLPDRATVLALMEGQV